ncbi:uncharacterized protein PAC_03483 [Phialocephala subalpina]|uniref:Heterokaryon incompatibility domain-containing protein n=1 Tax=Phialocephala subalpina TaxID=576137 RepID=A0A1L7WLH9_9HELO|nr:uncharacterized protein PAC_03483 [Phialocephala subalpina]
MLIFCLSWDLEIAKSKLNECDEKHSCRGAQDLPTRLLDLGIAGADRIKLVITAGKDIEDRRYAALSYCWGSSTPFTTQPSTLCKRLEGFVLSEVPATLRESIQVSRDLGIRYLWIDALCILQGSPGDAEAQEDWQRESVCMNKVYGNAYLTIVAAGSSDCSGGLIHGRPTCTDRGERVAFRDEPISRRAWAHQEWLLSGRLLVFTTIGMHFVCDEWEFPAFHASHAFRLPKSQAELTKGDWSYSHRP